MRVLNSLDTGVGWDGIPYSAYRNARECSAHTLFRVVGAMARVPPPCTLAFNHAFLCCLPKKSSLVTPCGTPAYRGKETRPLSLVNTDNRLSASTLRLCSEPIVSTWVSANPRGFIKGRSMLENIFDVDFAMREFSPLDARPGAVFFGHLAGP